MLLISRRYNACGNAPHVHPMCRYPDLRTHMPKGCDWNQTYFEVLATTPTPHRAMPQAIEVEEPQAPMLFGATRENCFVLIPFCAVSPFLMQRVYRLYYQDLFAHFKCRHHLKYGIDVALLLLAWFILDCLCVEPCFFRHERCPLVIVAENKKWVLPRSLSGVGAVL